MRRRRSLELDIVSFISLFRIRTANSFLRTISPCDESHSADDIFMSAYTKGRLKRAIRRKILFTL